MPNEIQIIVPWKNGGTVLEVGGGDIPLFRPNLDMRKLPTVDYVCDLEKHWPIEDDKFDGVFGRFVIEHMSWRAIPFFAQECFRVLKPGGAVLMVGPNTLEQCKEIARRDRITIDESAMLFGGQEERGWNEHKAAFSPAYATEIFKKAGFERVEIEPWPVAHTDMMIKAWKSEKVTIETDKKLGLNIGSFTVMAKSTDKTRWVNQDILDLSQYATQNGFDFRQSDVTKVPWEYPDGSVHFIISSHMLEHLTRNEGKIFLKECLRVLRPGGTIRITIPDSKKIASVYALAGLKGKYSDNEGVKNAEDEAEAFWNFMTVGHKTAYDEESVIRKMVEVGFETVSKCNPDHSGSPEIQTDTKDMYPDHSLFIEGNKSMTRKELLDKPIEERREILAKQVEQLVSHEKLKIGLLSTQFFGVPPKGYSGLEMVVWDLACGLSELGHTVRLFAPEGSRVPQNGSVVFNGPALNAVGVDWIKSEQESWNRINTSIRDLDILHGHNWFGFEYVAKNVNMKVCHTHHGHADPNWWTHTKPPYKLNFIGISQYMQREYESMGIPAKFVYNGIDMTRYPYKPTKGERLLFVGRLDTLKQPHIAIEIAKQLGMPIDVVGGTFVSDKAYMESILKMADGDKIVIHPDATHEKKLELMQNARCLLFPSNFKEPFGLVAAEAMACGTPVVALNDGAISEVVADGITGYICAEPVAMSQAVKDIDKIKPQDCHSRVENMFSRQAMAARYVELYREIIAGGEW